MNEDSHNDATTAQIEHYIERHPDAGVPQVLGALTLDPTEWFDVVGERVNQQAGGKPRSVLVNDEGDPDTDAPEGGLPDETPTPDAEKDGFDPVENGGIEIYEDGDDRVAGQPEDGGVRTDPDEFKRFHELLTAEAPDGYTPYYIKCERDEKGPFGGGAWSNPENRLSVEEAIAWLESGGNIGIVGTTDDCLVDLDVDDPDLVAEEDVKQTLRATSRSRGGYHGWYFGDDEIPNIDSDAGEVRAMNQYVLAPGSHVPVNLDDPDDPDLDEIAPSERENVGRYSLTEEHPVARLEYEEIPPIYREEHEQRQEVIEQRPDRRDDPPEPTGDGDNRSAVFDLDITDVTGLSWGYRGVNPIGHHSNDHRGNDRYFKIDREHGARDFKDNVSYSPASWVLADAGERDPRIPNGGLTDREYFVYWRYCKENNLVPADDPIPRRALVWVAIDTGLCDSDDVEDGWKLPADAHNDALDAVREKYDLDSGRDPVPSDDADAVAPLPLALLDRLTGEERERAARKRGLNIPTTDDARTRLRDAVFRELRGGNTTVLDAPTALGKSHTVATEPWRRRGDVTGEAPVIHLHATTDARDDAASKTRDSGANGAVLKGRKEISPLARGDHDPRAVAEADEDRQVVTIDGEPASQWLDRQCDEKGLPFSTALTLARERNDQDLDDLPPEGQEDPAVAQWNGIPRTEDGDPAKDVIHATHQFAYVPSLRRHTNVILDEQPDFTVEVSDERIQRGVSSYLQAINAPVSSWTGLIALADADLSGSTSDAAKERSALDDALDKDPPTEWYADDRDAHALAPDLARAVWRAVRYGDVDANGRRSAKVFHEPPRLDAGDGDQYAGAWLSVVIDDEDYTVRSVRSTPDLSQARAVVGLDAHPSMPMWELNGAPGMDRDAVLDPTERRLWRRYERGLSVVQIGDATRPRSGSNASEWMNDERVRAVLARLREHHGDDLETAITTAQVERAVRTVLDDVASEEIGEESTMHYGEEKSRNDFADERAGYLYGCMDPGDEMILDALAELDLDAVPATATTDDGDTVREKGRTFDGEDADTARAVLASVRENHVAQAAGRYARNADDPDSRATVYVHTDAVPTGYADYQVSGVEWLPTDTQREIIDELTARPNATTRDLADAVGCTKEHARETLQRLTDRDLVERREGAGEHGADVYQADGVEDGVGEVVETTNEPLCNPNRWSLAICDLHTSPNADTPTGTSSSDAKGRATGDDPPPDRGG